MCCSYGLLHLKRLHNSQWKAGTVCEYENIFATIYTVFYEAKTNQSLGLISFLETKQDRIRDKCL